MAALGVLVFVGGVAVGHWAFGSVGLLDAAFGGADVWTTTADISVLAMVVAGAGGGVVLLAGSLGLAWRWRRRRQTYRSSTDQGGIMETMDKTTPTFDSTERVLRINRWMAVGLVLALAAVVAMGAWLLIDNFVTSDVEALIADYNDAYEINDSAAWASLLVDDFRFVDANTGETFRGLEAFNANVARNLFLGFGAETLGPVSVNGNWVSVPVLVTFAHGEFEGYSVYEIEGDRIKQHIAALAPKRLP